MTYHVQAATDLLPSYGRPLPAGPRTRVRRCRRGFWLWEILNDQGEVRVAYGGHPSDAAARRHLAGALGPAADAGALLREALKD